MSGLSLTYETTYFSQARCAHKELILYQVRNKNYKNLHVPKDPLVDLQDEYNETTWLLHSTYA